MLFPSALARQQKAISCPLGANAGVGLTAWPATPACFPGPGGKPPPVKPLSSCPLPSLPFHCGGSGRCPFPSAAEAPSEHIFPMHAFSPLKDKRKRRLMSFSRPQRADSLFEDRTLDILSKGQRVTRGDSEHTEQGCCRAGQRQPCFT